MEQELKEKFEEIFRSITNCQPNKKEMQALAAANELGKSEKEAELEILLRQMIYGYTSVNEGAKVAVCKRILNRLTPPTK